MSRRRQRLLQINKLRGLSNPENINVQSDGMYNNPLYSGVGKTPFQPATQTVYSVAENETKNHDIIALSTKNKLCSKHKHLNKKEENSQGHTCLSASCSANIPFQQSIGDEYSWAKECFQDIEKDGLYVCHLTTDPDSSAYKAAEDIALKGNRNAKVNHSLDTRHFSANHRKHMKKNMNLVNICHGRTKADRTKMANNLAIDIADRCHAEINKAHKIHAGDFTKIKRKLSFTCDALVTCYQGQHNLCRKHSFVCKGGTSDNWVMRSSFLPKNFKISTSKESEDILRQCFAYRLSPTALSQSTINANTQKVEGFNRCLRRSLPRNVTFTTSFPGRAHAAAYAVNNTDGKAILNLCSAVGCEITEGSIVCNTLNSIQNEDKKRKEKQKSMKYKVSKSKRRQQLFKLYEENQEKLCYQKNSLLKKSLRQSRNPPKSNSDHTYTKSVKFQPSKNSCLPK